MATSSAYPPFKSKGTMIMKADMADMMNMDSPDGSSCVDIAEAIDAALDEVVDALTAGDTDSAMVLVVTAQALIDNLIAAMGGVDPDD